MFGRGFLFAEVVIVISYVVLCGSLMYLRDFKNLVNAEMVLALGLMSLVFGIVSLFDRRFIGPLLVFVSGMSLIHGIVAIFSRLFANNMPAFIMGCILFCVATIAGIICGYDIYFRVNESHDIDNSLARITFRAVLLFCIASSISAIYIFSNKT